MITCVFSKLAATGHTTSDYLRSVGLLSSDTLSSLDTIKIECIKLPDAINHTIKQADVKQGKDLFFAIDAITKEGVSLHFSLLGPSNRQQKAYCFIPMRNVACFYVMQDSGEE